MNVLGLDVERLERSVGMPLPNPERRYWGFYVGPVLVGTCFTVWVVLTTYLGWPDFPETFFFASMFGLSGVSEFGTVGQGICLGKYGRRVAAFSRVGWWMRGLSSLAYPVAILVSCVSFGGFLAWNMGDWVTGALIGGVAGLALSVFLLFFCIRTYRKLGRETWTEEARDV